VDPDSNPDQQHWFLDNRYVCEYPLWMVQVLGLDESIRPAVNKMRRNLLKLLNVGEFDPCATWQDPCISFTLPEVSCSWRNQERQCDGQSSWKATKVIPKARVVDPN
jgi:hypothetical protein